MERKKTALSRFFDVIGGVENVVLAIMVVGMIFTILVQIIGTLFFGFMIIYGWEVVQQQIMMKEMGTALMIPMYLIGICQPIAGVLGIIGVLQSFMEYHGNVEIAGKSKKDKETEEKEG